ncbi:molybdenum cofactor guanylyltransferase MobA [Thermococcus radiotolerans]|uniref:Probable molybdenum cofactor guanylyltransferase n=1 Tax=Thermococcus radiotolerans TaxID=187880 RepID=A0A2Z2MYD1_9EURY|nr:molybdenum cofactor guanylyltransferase MobA [Thermococcus radiotolerans]ASJ14501.1 molybdenum cofactor guanylyltransferase MobA [Thermococcus radiotolerans]
MLGAVLAGGRSKRFWGDKLLFRIGGRPLISYTLERIESASLIEEVVIVASADNAGRLRSLGYEVVVDELSIGPIGGVYTALGLGDAFVVAGDMPLIVPEFVDLMIQKFLGSEKLACVPRWTNGYLEPLHAAYSKAFRRVLEERIRSGDYSLNGAIRSADVCYLNVEKLPSLWKEGFFNVNRRSDLRKLLERKSE